jgi:MFS family permease
LAGPIWPFGPEDVEEIERAIGQSIAPAFLLTAIFGALNVLAGRLARLIDRERAIRNGLSPALPGELKRLARRAWCAHYAIGACVLAAILLCSLIVASFGGVFLGLRVAWLLAALLIGAMLSLIAALTLFLAEVRLASRHLPLSDDGGG